MTHVAPPVLGPSTPLEREVAALVAAGRLDDATATTLRAFGVELLGFLRGMLRRPEVADDAFSVLSLAVWRGLPAFTWRSSLRTWLYVLARRSVSRVTRGARREEIPLSQASALDALAAEVRATSMPALAAVRDRFADLRAQLDPDDQVLLVLRVDRDLPWRDIAQVLRDGDGAGESATAADAAAADLDRAAAALRKRFERVKARIRALARDAGVA